MRFPTVTGSNLERRKYRLPQDFEGELNLVFLAFQQVQQYDINTWLPLAKRLAATYPRLHYYELPTIREMNFLSRAMIDGGMRMGIPDRQARQATITLYLDKDEFREALDLPHENDIYVLVVDRQGEVHWRTSGRNSEERSAALQAFLAQAMMPARAREPM